MFLKFRVIDGEYIVKLSRGIVKHVYKVILFRFLRLDIKSLSSQNKNKSAMSGAQVVPTGIYFLIRHVLCFP